MPYANLSDPQTLNKYTYAPFYDTAQSTNVVQMQGLKTIAGAGQIVYGTDYPFGSLAKHLAGLRECGFSAAELTGIHRDNVLKLFPRLNS